MLEENVTFAKRNIQGLINSEITLLSTQWNLIPVELTLFLQKQVALQKKLSKYNFLFLLFLF